MVDTFRNRLADELAEADEPPIGDLVDAAITQGQRLVARRRLRIAAAALSVTVILGLTGAGLSLAGRHDPGGGSPPAAEGSTEEGVDATPEGLLELLLRLLPEGRTANYTGIRDQDRDTVSVQTYYIRDDRAGLVRLTVDRGGLLRSNLTEPQSPPSCSTANKLRCEQDRIGAAWSDGKTYQVITDDADCRRSASVTVLHPGNVRVTIDIDTCPALPPSSLATNAPPASNVPGARALLPLTPAEAVEIGSDPRWGLLIDPGLAEAGERRFPNLPEFARR